MYVRLAEVQPRADGPILAVLATDKRQDDGLALSMPGADLSLFRRNPILLVSHDLTRLPPGRVEDITVEQHRMTGRLRFASDPEAQATEQRVRDGFINSLSVGFDVDWSSVRQNGRVESWRLREVSLAPIGMDSEALVYARAGRIQPVDPNLAELYRIRDALQPVVTPAARQRILDALTLKGSRQ